MTFRLSKQLKEVSRIDRKDGKAKRVLQELIVLDANVNMVGMLAGPTTDNLLRRGGENVVILEGHKSPGNNVEVDNGSIGSAARSTQGPVTIDQATTETPAGTASAESAAVSALKQQRSLVQTIIEHMGIKAEDFAAYAIGRWGEKWSRTPAVLASVIRELQNAAAPDVDAYKLHIQIHAQLAKMGIADPLFGEYAIQKWGAGWATDPSNLGSALAEIRAHASEPEAYGSALQGEVSQA